jgi:hypothetical protein
MLFNMEWGWKFIMYVFVEGSGSKWYWSVSRRTEEDYEKQTKQPALDRI